MRSCRREEDALERNGFAVIESVGENTQGQCLGLGLRLLFGVPIHEHAGQFGHLGDPSTVALAINLDTEGHRRTIPELPSSA